MKKGGLTWKKRYFVLQSADTGSSRIAYYAKEGDDKLRGELAVTPETRLSDLSNKTNGFQVITEKKALVMYAETVEERAEWKKAIAASIASLNKATRDARAGFHIFSCSGNEFEMENKYELIKAVGHGAYGVVISCKNTENTGTGNNEQVAVKKIKDAFDDLVDAKRIVREIRLLRHFNHDNIIRIVDLPVPERLDFDDIYIVTDLMETDLHKVIYSRQPLSNDHSQYFLYQMLCALKYLHSTSVLHRDLKPSNILLNANCDLKLCDFGLSRGLNGELDGDNNLTEYVVTRWYRAPEIMLSCQEYSKAIDVWSLGCIFGEMLLRKPMFPGNDYIHQLKLITGFIGTPSAEDIWFVANEKARKFMLGLPSSPPVDLATHFPGADAGACDLLRQMLVLDPSARITVDDALAHEYLQPVRDVTLETVAEKEIDWGEIEDCELTKSNLQKIIWQDVGVYHPNAREEMKAV
jgi:mitogen-activated protein kinase 1/3